MARRRIARFGVIGDVHGEDVRLRRAYRAFDGATLDAVLAVGDFVDGEGDVEACLELLSRRGAEMVLGNHDRWFLSGELRTLPHATTSLSDDATNLLTSLCPTLDFETPRGVLRLAHGVGADDMAELRPDTRGYALQATGLRELMLEAGLVHHVGGHTHVRMARAFPGLVAINAGTLSGDEPTAVIVDLERDELVFLDLSTDELGERERLRLPSPLPLPEGA